MKKLLLLLALISSPLIAEEMTCETIGELAEVIMTARQYEVPMSEVLSAPGANYFKDAIISAYDIKIRKTDKGKRNMIKFFRDAFEQQCEMDE